ncbi:TPA: hypothetical protein HA265_07175 [Candidatus Woesearchaeota archaeon]|nr:hypothetical protein [Candidatus Woesearchaeota archaeon]
MVIISVLIVLMYNISQGAKEQAYHTRCKASVLAYSKLLNMPFGDKVADTADIECPTQFLTIEKGSSLSMKRDVANLMFQCWNNFGEGDIPLFSQTDDKFCVV